MATNGSLGLATVLGLCTLGLATPTVAASPATPSPDVKAARELFTLAEADEDAGRWADALEKLRRILATRDTAGVRYHVALCEEALGHLAAAERDFAVADTSARAEQAHDVLRLVGKKLSAIAPRVPHVTIRVVPASRDATVTIDGHEAQAEEPTAIDPGPHDVEVMPADRRPASAVSFAIGEGESKTVDVGLSPPPAASALPAETGALPASTLAEVPRKSPTHTVAILAGAGAVLLAGAGVAAYAAGGAAHDQAVRACALVPATSGSSCDPDRVAVRAWDWAAVGAWAGAGALATWAIVSGSKSATSSTGATVLGARLVVGAGSVALEGAF